MEANRIGCRWDDEGQSQRYLSILRAESAILVASKVVPSLFGSSRSMPVKPLQLMRIYDLHENKRLSSESMTLQLTKSWIGYICQKLMLKMKKKRDEKEKYKKRSEHLQGEKVRGGNKKKAA